MLEKLPLSKTVPASSWLFFSIITDSLPKILDQASKGWWGLWSSFTLKHHRAP